MFDKGFFQIEDLSYVDKEFQKIVDEYNRLAPPLERYRLVILRTKWKDFTDDQRSKLREMFDDIQVEG